jgi:DNA-binding MarR family transcriptional regulator
MKNGNTLDKRVDDLSARLKAQQEDILMDNYLAFNITSDIVLNFVDKELQKMGVNRTQMGIFLSLVLGGGTMTPTELSRSVLRSKYATIKAIDSLEKLNLVKSEKAGFPSKTKEDRRLRKVSLTEKAVEFIQQQMASRHETGSLVMSCLSQKEQEQLKTILSRLRKHVTDLQYKGKSRQNSILEDELINQLTPRKNRKCQGYCVKLTSIK